MLKPIKQSLGALIESSPNLPNSTSPQEAAARAKVMFGCYRKGDANDPETYCAAVAATLACYSPTIVRHVTDPRSGLPGQSDFLPTVKEVRDACEEIVNREAKALEYAELERRQLAERRALEEFYRDQPKVDLKVRCGENYGLSVDLTKESDETRAKRQEVMREANRRTLLAEYEQAGIEPVQVAGDMLISLSLRRKLQMQP